MPGPVETRAPPAAAPPGMTGAESLLETLRACGVEACFANPGTSEIGLVAGLEAQDRIRPVLCLFEGVATGAADGYGRMARRPAATLLHLGPGFANGWANLHNARKAGTPVVNLVGQHATWHVPLGGALHSDLEGAAASVSDWLRVSRTASEVGADAADAVRAATGGGGRIATLVLPADAGWEAGGVAGAPRAADPPAPVAVARIEAAAAALASARRVAVLAAGPALFGAGRQACERIAAATGAAFFCTSLYARMERGAGRMAFRRIPGWGRTAREMLGAFDEVILAGAAPPVLSFGHPEFESRLIPDSVRVSRLAGPGDDVAGALAALADALGPAPPAAAAPAAARAAPGPPEGRLTGAAVGRTLARFLPEGAVVSDESGTAGAAAWPEAAGAAPHDSLYLTGGSIGQALPVALGAAIACPGRKTVCLQADGGGMYTLQALWSMAREGCDATVVILANRAYGILVRSFGEYGAAGPENRIPALFDLSNPELRWAKLAEGMGVAADVCDGAEAFDRVFADCMAGSGPRLIEAVV